MNKFQEFFMLQNIANKVVYGLITSRAASDSLSLL